MSELLSSDCVMELLEDTEAELPSDKDFVDVLVVGEFVTVIMTG